MSDSETCSSTATNSRSPSPRRRASTEDTEGYVIDIGGSCLDDSMSAELDCKLLWRHGEHRNERILPCSVLHNEAGLRIWADITQMPEYYQTRDEIELLEQNAKDLVQALAACVTRKGESLTLIDLGCGDVRKVVPLLDAMEAKHVRVQYFALDLAREVLVDSVHKLRSRYCSVKCFGLWGTFDDCWKWAQLLQSPKCYMSLGSMVGNDHFKVAVCRLREWADILRPQDRLLLGLDGTTDYETIWRSYHDEHGLFHKFVRNGLQHSNEILGHEWYKAQDWEITGAIQHEPLMHHFVVEAVRNVKYAPLGLDFVRGDKIICYEGFKYGPSMMQRQFDQANLTLGKQWRSPSTRIYQYLLSRASFQ